VVLALAELPRNPMNAFVLFVIAGTFLKGFVVKKKSYGFVASLLAVSFAVLSTLVLLATGEFCFGMFGYVTIPILFKSYFRLEETSETWTEGTERSSGRRDT